MKNIRFISLVVVIIASFALITGCAKNVYSVTKTAGDLTVNMQINNNPPTTGTNILTVGIKDNEDKYVTDADVKVNYSMPAMPGMPPMSYDTDAKLSGNVYKADINLSMAGPWNIAVKITRDSDVQKTKFSIDVR